MIILLVPSPIASPIRPQEVAATDDSLLEREKIAGVLDARIVRHAPRLRATPARGRADRDGPRRAAGRAMT